MRHHKTASRIRSAVSAGVALSMLPALPAHADWSGKAEAGYVMARGNTDTDSANAKFELARARERWKHAIAATALYGQWHLDKPQRD